MIAHDPIPNDGLAPLAPSDTSCCLIVERIDPAANERRVVYEVICSTLEQGFEEVEAYLKRRHQRGYFIWRHGWAQYTCVLYDGVKCEGTYLAVRLEAATIAAN